MYNYFSFASWNSIGIIPAVNDSCNCEAVAIGYTNSQMVTQKT